MDKLLEVLESSFRRLCGNDSNPRAIEEIIDGEIKEKTGREIWCCSKTGRVHGTVRLIESAKKSLIINVNHRNFYELEVMNDSYIYSALYDAASRGVNIDLVATHDACSKLRVDILNIVEPFVADTDDFTSSMIVDGRPMKNVYATDGKTVFTFCW